MQGNAKAGRDLLSKKQFERPLPTQAEDHTVLRCQEEVNRRDPQVGKVDQRRQELLCKSLLLGF